jgi:protein associated with RNAse G/E
MGGLVHIDFRKWPDRKHWQFAMHRLGEDEHGTWLWSPPGIVARRGDEAPRVFSALNVKLITRDKWWTAIWNDRSPKVELYVDIATPARWEDDRVTMIDLDLDIVRRRNGLVEVLDEDEFAEHRALYGYPPDIVDRARTATASVFLDVESHREPFGSVANSWLAAATSRLEA